MTRSAAHGLRDELGSRPGLEGPFQWGVVTATHTSPNTVDVKLDGAATATAGIRYLASYTPAVNDVVLVGRMSGPARSARFVINKLA